jgi:type III pantothenate kinase
MSEKNNWLGLAIGNSRLHWGYFRDNKLERVWYEEHLQKGNLAALELPLYIASVVPEQTKLWLDLPKVKEIQLKDIPLEGMYSTLGIDRALTLWGGGCRWGFPCLVIDAGTALTLTGANARGCLIGGAILPGLSTQIRSLWQKTAALPEISLPETLPVRWARDTHRAISSGIIYTVVAGILNFIEDWQIQFPQSKIAIAGGDAIVLSRYLDSIKPELAIAVEPDLVFEGMRAIIL